MNPSAHSDTRGGRSAASAHMDRFASPSVPRSGHSACNPTPAASDATIDRSGYRRIVASVESWKTASATTATRAATDFGPAWATNTRTTTPAVIGIRNASHVRCRVIVRTPPIVVRNGAWHISPMDELRAPLILGTDIVG